MAKKARKKQEIVQGVQPPAARFDEMFPTIARWITQGGSVDGCWATHQLATSMDYSPDSRLANWLLGAVNAHAAHHLFPDVCHVHYVALSKIIREVAQEYGVPYHAMPFPAALRSHFRHLKRMGEAQTPTPVEGVAGVAV